MSQISFHASKNVQTIHCQRGTYSYRKQEIDSGITLIEYKPLPDSRVIITNGNYQGYKDIGIKAPDKFYITVEAPHDEPTTKSIKSDSDGSKEKGREIVLEVGNELRGDAEALRGTVEVQVSSVDEGDARRESVTHSGEESSPDGLHSGDDASGVLHNRHHEGVSTVSPPKQDAGRNGLLRYKI